MKAAMHLAICKLFFRFVLSATCLPLWVGRDRFYYRYFYRAAAAVLKLKTHDSARREEEVA